MDRKDSQPSVKDEAGHIVRLQDLQMVAFRLSCGHVDKGYGYRKGDLYFCPVCLDHKRIAKIVG